MTAWEALLLGFVQGLTEFLPVSSSGHLAVVQIFLALPNDLFFNVLLHLATLAAVVIFFWKDILRLRMKEWSWLAVGTIPAGIVGVLFGDQIDSAANVLMIVAVGFIVSGIANLVSQWLLKRENIRDWPTLWQTIAIGLAQSIALLPGVSRSGSTVSAGLLFGLNREAAFRFSFLLLIPATVGAVGLETLKVFRAGVQVTNGLLLAMGMTVAFVTGFASLHLLQIMMRKAKFNLFGYYCLALGIGLLVFSLR